MRLIPMRGDQFVPVGEGQASGLCTPVSKLMVLTQSSLFPEMLSFIRPSSEVVKEERILKKISTDKSDWHPFKFKQRLVFVYTTLTLFQYRIPNSASSQVTGSIFMLTMPNNSILGHSGKFWDVLFNG